MSREAQFCKYHFGVTLMIHDEIQTTPLPRVNAPNELIDVPIDFAQPFLRTEFNYDRDFASEASGLHCTDPSLTQQQFKDETDINEIVRRFGLTGELPGDFNMPQSADLVDAITDYHTALNTIREADEEFMSMPPELRARFDNDPGKLIAFLEDGGNREEAVKLGLVKAPDPVPQPLEVRVIQDPVEL